MDNFFPHVNRSAIEIERDFYNIDRPDYARAKPAGADEDDFLVLRHWKEVIIAPAKASELSVR
jgi:hypothetical protein